MKVRKGWIAALVGTFAVGVASGVVRRGFTRFEVSEESMAPSLLPGDYLFARRPRTLRRGQVVILDNPIPGGPSPLVKRVVAVSGESLEIGKGQVFVDGRPLAEPWANGPTLGEGHWQLERDQVFVMGDNRAADSVDGRSFGPTPVEDVLWQAVLRYWPPSRAGRPAELPAAE